VFVVLSQCVPDGYNLEISQDKAIPGHPGVRAQAIAPGDKLFETGFSAQDWIRRRWSDLHADLEWIARFGLAPKSAQSFIR
jgi:hypothetical protein